MAVLLFYFAHGLSIEEHNVTQQRNFPTLPAYLLQQTFAPGRQKTDFDLFEFEVGHQFQDGCLTTSCVGITIIVCWSCIHPLWNKFQNLLSILYLNALVAILECGHCRNEKCRINYRIDIHRVNNSLTRCSVSSSNLTNTFREHYPLPRWRSWFDQPYNGGGSMSVV